MHLKMLVTGHSGSVCDGHVGGDRRGSCRGWRPPNPARRHTLRMTRDGVSFLLDWALFLALFDLLVSWDLGNPMARNPSAPGVAGHAERRPFYSWKFMNWGGLTRGAF